MDFTGNLHNAAIAPTASLIAIPSLDCATPWSSRPWKTASAAPATARPPRLPRRQRVRRSVLAVTTDLKLGLQVGYWTAEPPAGRDLIELAQQVEALGFDSIWTGESWSSDAFSPLVWAAAHTSRINLATGIAQMSARSPVTMAMHAMTLDALSNGRFRLGIGVAGPPGGRGRGGGAFRA